MWRSRGRSSRRRRLSFQQCERREQGSRSETTEQRNSGTGFTRRLGGRVGQTKAGIAAGTSLDEHFF